ncbi:MAG TPA: sulfate ABC transporter permease subunit CysW, partial [Povalibacter sp.]|nr:sulfate ABC transporter permease subunit CysW [Povalibacter sp.]
MAGGPSKALLAELASRPGRDSFTSSLIKGTFIGVSLLFLAALLFAPLITVFASALAKGYKLYFQSFLDADTLAAIRLTLFTAAVVVPINTVFGVAAAWAIAKFEFKGKSILITLIDLPIAVSPVISGLIYVLLFGMQGWFGLWLQDHDISIIFALPG